MSVFGISALPLATCATGLICVLGVLIIFALGAGGTLGLFATWAASGAPSGATLFSRFKNFTGLTGAGETAGETAGAASAGGSEPAVGAELDGAEVQLEIAYKNWRTTSILYKRLRTTSNQCVTIRNLLENWLLLHPTHDRKNRTDLVAALAKKCTNMPKGVYAEIVRGAHWVTDAPTSKQKPSNEMGLTPSTITYGTFRLNRTPRIEQMLATAGSVATLRSALCYMGALASIHMRAVPENVFTAMWGAGVRYEAFASPLDSNVLSRGPPAVTGGGFFSRFPDADKPFGSKGDFLETPFNELERLQGGIVFNPPTLRSILERAAEIAARLAKTHLVFFVAPLDMAKEALAPFAAAAVSDRTLAAREHCYTIQGPTGPECRSSPFASTIFIAGPAADEATLARVVDTWAAVPPDGRSQVDTSGGPNVPAEARLVGNGATGSEF